MIHEQKDKDKTVLNIKSQTKISTANRPHSCVFFWAVDARKLLWIESCEMDVLVGFDILFIPFSVLGYKTK